MLPQLRTKSLAGLDTSLTISQSPLATSPTEVETREERQAAFVNAVDQYGQRGLLLKPTGQRVRSHCWSKWG